MAVKKKSFRARKRRVYKKKSYKKKSGLAPKWQKASKVERKYLDNNLADNVPISATGGIIGSSINVIAQGSGTNQRIGREVLVTRIHCNMTLTMPQAANDTTLTNATDDQVKLFLVLDTMKNGSSPAWTDIFSGTNFSDFINLGNSKRFRILKKWHVSLHPQASVYDNAGTPTVFRPSTSVILKKTIKCKIPINWTPTNTTGAENAMNTNNILLAGISTNAKTILSGGNSGSPPFFTCFRLRFTDS